MIKRISVDDLQVGMYVCDKPAEIELNTLESKGFVRRKSTIYKIKQAGAEYIYIDTEKGIDPRSPIDSSPTKASQPKPPTESARKEASKIYKKSLLQINKAMSDAKLGKRIDISPIEEVASEICKTVSKNPLALQWLTQVNENAAAVFEHSINCGILMGIFARHLGFSHEETSQKITGALFHDIGESKVTPALLNRGENELGETELEERKKHVDYGIEILNEAEIKDQSLIEMCLHHHEKIDGSGYPEGLSGNNISINGKLMALVDKYENLTSNRSDGIDYTPCIAMKKIQELGETTLDEELISEFLKCFGIYPSGTLVELSNGRLAVVITPNADSPQKPYIRIIYNRITSCYEPITELDLGVSKKGVVIVRSVHPKKYNINLEDFL
ncbi:MAG: DUF3391 domain-containing protein [Agarilytica sp.]